MSKWIEVFKDVYASKEFDPDFYMRRYPDVVLTGLPSLEHYAKYGISFGRYINKSSERHPTRAFVQKTPTISDEHPLLTVICTTYNHIKYIKDALDGFVSQRTNFEFEVLISDDCSTDGTANIINEYALKYKFIKPIIRHKNLGSMPNLIDTANRVKSKYVAMCEGDDFWSDPDKLQKQVDFLESNPQYSLCFHPVTIFYEDSPEIVEVFPPESHIDFSAEKLIRANFIQTNSVVYRWRYTSGLPQEFSGVHPGDWFLHLAHAEMGRIGFLKENMGVYRKHASGMWIDAGSNPIALHMKYGAGEIKMFEVMKSHFGGCFDRYLIEMQKHVISEVFKQFMLHGDIEGFAKFVCSAGECERLILNYCGIDIPETQNSIEYKDVLSLIRDNTRVSVIVTSYNHKDYLSQCLDNILSQTCCGGMEIIIGDDSSTDGTQEIISHYILKYPKIIRQVKYSSRMGMVENLKKCFSEAKYPFVAICEGDDYWLSQSKIVKQLTTLLLNPDMSMVFNWVLLYEEWSSRFIPHAFQSSIHRSRISFADIAAEPVTANFSACMYRSSTIANIPEDFYNDKNAADWLFNLYAAEIGDIGFIPDLMSVYRLHLKGSWSGQTQLQKKTRMSQLKKSFFDIFGEGYGFDDYKYISTVSEINSINNNVLGWLETPHDNELFNDLRGYIRFRGWATTNIGGPIVILIEQNGDVTEHKTDIERKDVVESLHRNAGIVIVDKMCGFNICLKYNSNFDVRFGFRINGKPFWWKQIKVNKSINTDKASIHATKIRSLTQTH